MLQKRFLFHKIELMPSIFVGGTSSANFWLLDAVKKLVSAHVIVFAVHILIEISNNFLGILPYILPCWTFILSYLTFISHLN